MTCIIVEDEPLAQFRLRDYIQKTPGLKLEACFDTAQDALQFLQQQTVDLLFLDIHLDGLSGVQLLEQFKPAAQVIFTTAYQEYALKGYELHITDYLLKPFTFNRFLQAVNKAQDNIVRSNTDQSAPEFIFVKTENRLEKIMIDDILYIEGMRDYLKIHTVDKKIMTLQSFSEFEKTIPSNLVCRVHKSYMVSLNKIESIERSRIKIGQELIPVSETYKEAFYQHINNKPLP